MIAPSTSVSASALAPRDTASWKPSRRAATGEPASSPCRQRARPRSASSWCWYWFSASSKAPARCEARAAALREFAALLGGELSRVEADDDVGGREGVVQRACPDCCATERNSRWFIPLRLRLGTCEAPSDLRTNSCAKPPQLTPQFPAEPPVSREISGLCNLASFGRRLNSSDRPSSVSFWTFHISHNIADFISQSSKQMTNLYFYGIRTKENFATPAALDWDHLISGAYLHAQYLPIAELPTSSPN